MAATTKSPVSTTEIGLVLQGGGALGAYEYGGILALLDVIDELAANGQDVALKAVTGVSIGAINAACVVGAADRSDARRRLAALWDDLAIETPPFVPAQLSRDLGLFGVANFYRPRLDLLTMPSWTYIYDTHPMLETLARHVDFAALNANKIAFVVTAVDVESGELTRFANRRIGDTKATTIEPRHVLASGSLPPQFPWTDIADGREMHHYWDGGVVDNTPLGDAIDGFSTSAGVRRVLVVMNLFPQQARLPQSYAEVGERADQLRYGNRLRQDSKSARQINALISIIERLAELVPAGRLPADLLDQVDTARAYKLVEPIEISLAPSKLAKNEYVFRDFSRQGIAARRDAGRRLTLEKLRPFLASTS
jgi:NTE family protein